MDELGQLRIAGPSIREMASSDCLGSVTCHLQIPMVRPSLSKPRGPRVGNRGLLAQTREPSPEDTRKEGGWLHAEKAETTASR